MSETVLAQLLAELHQESTDITASAILSSDGMMLASHLPNNMSEDKLAAMSAAFLSVGDKMIQDLLGGITDRVMVQSGIGYVIVTAIAQELLLVVIARPDAKLGMAFHEIKEVAKNLQFLEYGVR